MPRRPWDEEPEEMEEPVEAPPRPPLAPPPPPPASSLPFGVVRVEFLDTGAKATMTARMAAELGGRVKIIEHGA